MLKFFCLMILPSVLLAHTDGGGTGLLKGLMHPIMGLDHLLAMVSVGVVSSQLGGRHVWLIPVMFVSSMLAGGILGIFGVPMPYTEMGIAISVLVLGLSIAVAQQKTKAWPVYCFVSLFGVLHGYAHGAEIPRSIGPGLYVTGFLFTTSSLHIVGVILGELAGMSRWRMPILRACGAAVAAMGCFFLLK